LSRAEFAEQFLQRRLASLCRLDAYSPDRWTFEPHGWSPPVQHEGLFVFRFCPAVLADQATDLDDREFEGYLRAVVATIQLHIIHSDLPYHERVQRVDDELYDLASGTLELLSRVQLGALDR
jgi:hypothetical protein